MKKNIHIIIGLILIFIGLVISVFGLINTGINFNPNSFKGQITMTHDFEFVELNSIIYEGHVGDIEVIRTNTEFIKVKTKRNPSAKLDLKTIDGVLYIKQDEISLVGNNECEIIIEMPKDKTIDLSVSINLGEVEIKNSNIKNINISINVGEVDIDNVNFTNLYVFVSVGDIDINTGDTKDNYTINGEGSGSKIINANTNLGELNIN